MVNSAQLTICVISGQEAISISTEYQIQYMTAVMFKKNADYMKLCLHQQWVVVKEKASRLLIV